MGAGSVGLEADVGGHADDVNGYGLDTPRRGVIFLPTGQEAGEAEVGVTSACQTGIFFPHEGQCLAHGTNGVFHRARADESSAGRYFPASISFGKEEDGMDGIVNIEEWVDVVSSAEGGPD